MDEILSFSKAILPVVPILIPEESAQFFQGDGGFIACVQVRALV